jgi:hypothetical protein
MRADDEEAAMRADEEAAMKADEEVAMKASRNLFAGDEIKADVNGAGKVKENNAAGERSRRNMFHSSSVILRPCSTDNGLVELEDSSYEEEDSVGDGVVVFDGDKEGLLYRGGRRAGTVSAQDDALKTKHPEPNFVQIFVQPASGTTFTIDVDFSHTVLMLKSQIRDKGGFPIDQQRITHSGMQLEDRQQLLCYNLVKECTVQMSFFLLGSGDGNDAPAASDKIGRHAPHERGRFNSDRPPVRRDGEGKFMARSPSPDPPHTVDGANTDSHAADMAAGTLPSLSRAHTHTNIRTQVSFIDLAHATHAHTHAHTHTQTHTHRSQH